VLGGGAGGQIVAGDQLLAQMPARTFGQQRVFGVQLETGLESVFRLAVLVTPHVAGRHTLH
jgi:hypothetical protein